MEGRPIACYAQDGAYLGGSLGERHADTIVRVLQIASRAKIPVVAFDTDKEWSKDVTKEIASKLLDMSRQGHSLGAAANEFVERVTGQTPIAVA